MIDWNDFPTFLQDQGLQKTPFSNLTNAEAERLAILAEECGEVVQMVGKVLRHGYRSSSPLKPKGSPNNRALLSMEIGHIYAAVRRMVEANDIDAHVVVTNGDDKFLSASPYLHHQIYREG